MEDKNKPLFALTVGEFLDLQKKAEQETQARETVSPAVAGFLFFLSYLGKTPPGIFPPPKPTYKTDPPSGVKLDGKFPRAFKAA